MADASAQFGYRSDEYKNPADMNRAELAAHWQRLQKMAYGGTSVDGCLASAGAAFAFDERAHPKPVQMLVQDGVDPNEHKAEIAATLANARTKVPVLPVKRVKQAACAAA